MKIEIIKEKSNSNDTWISEFLNWTTVYNIEITIEERDKKGQINQKIYYGTLNKNSLYGINNVQYNQETPERLKIAVEQMIKFL